jgi:3-hydroxyacyl-CoA dehydrogenase
MGYLAEHTPVVMNSDRRLFVAKQEVVRLSEEGYLPPPVSTDIPVLGRKTAAAFEVALQQYRNGNYISDYDVHLGTKLAHVITGGDLSAPQTVHEDYLIALEREVFMSLLGEQKTMERIQYMLENRKPLRN